MGLVGGGDWIDEWRGGGFKWAKRHGILRAESLRKFTSQFSPHPIKNPTGNMPPVILLFFIGILATMSKLAVEGEEVRSGFFFEENCQI